MFADQILNDVFAGVQNIENAQPASELLTKFGLDWKVAKENLILPDGSPTPYFGIVRQDSRQCFTTCKEGYTPFQNSELAELLIRLSEKTGYEIHKGGMFNGGGKVYLQLASPNKIAGIGNNNDTVNGFLTGLNGHDGTTSLKWGETNITISCSNTFMAAKQELKHSARHTQSIHDKVEQSIREITGIIAEEKSLFDTFIRLSEVPVTKNAIIQVVKQATEVDTALSSLDLKNKYSTYSVNRANEMLTAIGKEIRQKGETMWGLFSGVTAYTNHVMPAPKRDNARLESIYTGTGYQVNNDAFKLVRELAHV